MVMGTRNRSSTPRNDSSIDAKPAARRTITRAPPAAANTIDDIIDRAEELTKSRNVVAKASKAANRRMTEKEEDALIVNDEADDGADDLNIPRFDVQPPNIVGGTMKNYQLVGLNWLVRLYETKINGILADEMGLGKTLQTISLVAYLRQYRKLYGPHLIVVPKSTMGNWANEFRKWCPDVDVFLLQGNKDERGELVQTRLKPLKFDVCVTSYEMVLREKGPIRRISWHILVVDEAHRLKNENSCLSQVLRLFTSRARLLITGTPLQNNLHELWSLLNFLMPNLFDSAGEFDAFLNVADADDETGGQLLSKLHAILRPFLLRRLKTDVAKDIPPKIETLLYVGMSSVQKEIYRAVFQKDYSAIQGTTKNSKRLLNVMMQLRKAANHPYLFEGIEDRSLPVYGEHMITNSGKLVVLDKLLRRLKQQGSRVLVFSQMTRVLDILEDYCVYREYEYCRIDGSTNTEEREQQMMEFNADGSSKFIFLLSSRAGGLGINLQTADIVVLYDSDWNPQMDLQAQDRAHRIGQKKTVHVYRFVTEHTIEEKIIERAEMKLRLDAMVIQQGRLSDRNTKMSKDEMVALIRYGADEIFRSKDSTITDEDIDLILSKGTERTEQLAQKLSEFEKSVANFTMTGDDTAAEQTFMSLAGADQGASKAENLAFLTKVSSALGKRDRVKCRTSYDVDQYYKEVMDDKRRKSGGTSGPRPKRLPQMFDFQFMDRDRLTDLVDKEHARWAMETDGHDELDLPPALTEEEQAEKERLLVEGFPQWSRRDFNRYLRACERFGRDGIENIVKAIHDKPEQEVRQYHITFWKQYTQVEGWERIIKAIERGESRLVRGKEIQELIARAIQNAGPDPMQSLELKYGAQHKGKGYTELNDRFLLVKTAEFGYGDWERLHMSIMASPLFSFDYFLKSRSSVELNRRVDVLARICEKELNQKQESVEGDKKAKVSEKKSRPTSSK